MSDYVRQNDFSIKDALPSGSAQKIIKGSDVDAEFDALVVAVASKLDNISAATTGNIPLIGASGTTLTDSGYSPDEIRFPVVNVKQYGAKGDDATDDTSAIQTAIGAALSISGGALYFPAGTYLISASLTIPLYTNFRVFGDSRGGTTIEQTTDNTPIWTFTKENAHNFLFEHMNLTWTNLQPVTNTLAIGFYFNMDTGVGAGCYNYEIRHISFSRGYRGIAANPASNKCSCWGWSYDKLVFNGSMSGSAISHYIEPVTGQPNQYIGSIYIRGDSIDASEPILNLRACHTLHIANLEVNVFYGNRLIYGVGGCGITIDNIRLETFELTTSSGSLFYVPDGHLHIRRLSVRGDTNTVDIGAGNKLYVFSVSGGSVGNQYTKVEILDLDFTVSSGTVYVFSNGYGVIEHIREMTGAYLTDIASSAAANTVCVQSWLQPRLSADNGDADVILSYTVDDPPATTQLFLSDFSANRTITLPEGAGAADSNIFNGCYFDIVSRNTAAFTLKILNAAGATIYTIPSATKMAVKVMYQRFSWRVVSELTLT